MSRRAKGARQREGWTTMRVPAVRQVVRAASGGRPRVFLAPIVDDGDGRGLGVALASGWRVQQFALAWGRLLALRAAGRQHLTKREAEELAPLCVPVGKART